MKSELRTRLVPMVGVLLAAFGLRLTQLGQESLWYDESVSALLASKPVGELVAHTARDIHPPLYYILLHYWRALAGPSEFALAFFSLFWGVVLVAVGYLLGRWLGSRNTGLLTAALIALSPFNIWYSQEVRMYTLGATLGALTLLALWKLSTQARMKRRWMLLWLVAATAGLYTLYYFALLLVAEAIWLLVTLRRRRDGERLRRWLGLAAALALLYAPWLPTLGRQALSPPVPPWRSPEPPLGQLLESLAALAVGQSLEPASLGLWMLGLLVVLVGGLWLRQRRRDSGTAIALLAAALLVPLALLLASTLTPLPLYHVRYVFTFSPAFYALLAMAFIGWSAEARRRGRLVGALLAAALLMTPLLVLSAESLQRFWNDSAYAADDLRGGIERLEERWRAHDVALFNAGYTYPALVAYFDDPVAWMGRLPDWEGRTSSGGLTTLLGGTVDGDAQLGWGLAESDFYAMPLDETLDILDESAERAPRLWHFRLYDTVTDPDGQLRDWLERNGRLFEDTLLTGESNARLQGWYFPPVPEERPVRPFAARYLDPTSGIPAITLHGVDLPGGTVSEGGAWVDIVLWLEATAGFDPATRLSLGLFESSAAGRQWAIADEQPFGPLLSLAELGGMQRWPVRLRLPLGLPPDKYELRLKFYRPESGETLVAEGEGVVTHDQIRVSVIETLPTVPTTREPRVGTPLRASFGLLELLGHQIPQGPWEPGAVIPVELIWRQLGPPQEDLSIFLSSGILAADNGGVAGIYPPENWQPGEIIRDVHYVTVAPDAAPGRYPLTLAVSRGASPIPWSRGFFRQGDTLPLGELEIRDRERRFEPPASARPLDIRFGASIALVGSEPLAPTYAPGGEIPIVLHWRAVERPPTRYKVFTHLIGPDGNLRAQRDLEPGDGLLPTIGWAPGEYISMAYALPVPADAPPGPYEIRVGLYDPITNERLLPSGNEVDPEGRHWLLGRIEVVP